MTITPRIEVTLYQHDASDKALLLSPCGNPRRAQWIPLSRVTVPQATKLVKRFDAPCEEGIFCVEGWKLRELGWLMGDHNEAQGELL